MAGTPPGDGIQQSKDPQSAAVQKGLREGERVRHRPGQLRRIRQTTRELRANALCTPRLKYSSSRDTPRGGGMLRRFT